MFKLHGLVVMLVLACSCGHFATAQVANVTIPPQAVNVSANEVAVFTCTGVANSFTWRGNGDQIDEDPVGEIVITTTLLNSTLNIRMSTLELTVSSTDNATNITCTAISEIPTLTTSNESVPALLLVQGLLNSVNDLDVDSINATAVRISWNPPVSLEGVPILKYTVTITNATSGDEIIKTMNTTMLYYVFSIDSPDPDSEFNVTVIPINMVGAGEVSLDFKFSVQEVTISSTASAPSSTIASIVITTSDNPVGTMMPSPGGFNPTLDSSIGIIVGVVVGVSVLACVVSILVPILICCCNGTILKKHSRGITDEDLLPMPSIEHDDPGFDPRSYRTNVYALNSEEVQTKRRTDRVYSTLTKNQDEQTLPLLTTSDHEEENESST